MELLKSSSAWVMESKKKTSFEEEVFRIKWSFYTII